VAIAYAIGAWVLLQFGDTILSLLALPEWAGQVLVAVVVMGLPVALVLAWIFDISPERTVAEERTSKRTASEFSYSDPKPVDVGELNLARLSLTELIGRRSECDVIRRQLEEALEGRGGIVLIGGEPGVGKTRLGEEALEIGRDLGMLPLVGHAYEEHGAPFIVAVEILEELSRSLPQEMLRNVLGGTAPEMARLLPDLRRAYPNIPESLELPPEQQQRYLFNAVLEFLTRLTKCCPVVLLLDDQHWADESSTLLLEHLAPRVTQLPLLMVVTYRDHDADQGEPFRRSLPQLSRQRFATRLPLKHLGRNEVRDLLADLGGPNLPEAIVDLIYEETSGNAFFVQSVYRHLAEEGRLFDSTGDWLKNIDAEHLAVPESVRLVIQRRLERLDESTLRSLTVAAIMGLRFDAKILEAAGKLTGDEMIEAIETAETARLILPSVGRHKNRFEFAHALVRQTLLENLSSLRRARLHLDIADAMESAYGESGANAADIARHLYRSGDEADRARTVRFLQLAADHAVQSAASQEAVEHIEKALALLPEEEDLERAALYQRCGALRPNADVEQADKDLHAALAIYRNHDHAENIAEITVLLCLHCTWTGKAEEGHLLSTEGLALVGEDISTARCKMLSALGMACSVSAQSRESKRWHDEAIAMADALGDKELLAEILANSAVSHWQRLNAAAMVRDAERAVGLNRAGYRAWDLPNSLNWYGLGLPMMGRFDEALAVTTENLVYALKVGDTLIQMECNLAQGMIHAAAGDLAQAIACSEEVVAINDAHGFPWGGHFYSVLADLQMRSGDWSRALENYQVAETKTVSGTCWDFGDLSYMLIGYSKIAPERFEAIWQRVQPAIFDHALDIPSGRVQCLLAAVEGLAEMGRFKDAGAYYHRVRELAESGTLVAQFHTCLVSKTVSIAAMAAGDYDASQRYFDAAVTQADELPYATEQGEVRRWYAKMLIQRDDADDKNRAKTLLQEAITVYERVGMPEHERMVRDMVSVI
jgi:tetratricopeptide (TPR) repeat protein